MRRRRLRAGLLAVVVLALGGMGWKVWRRVSVEAPRTLEKLGIDMLPKVAQHIRNFRRVKVKDGRTVWEITASDAQYSEQNHEIVVQQPQVTVWLQDGDRRARLVSRQGHLFLDGKELERVTLDGDVVLWLDDMELRTDHAVYQRGTDRITVPGDVTIKGSRLDVQARGMEVDVTPQRVRLQSAVRTMLRSDAKTS